MLNDSPCIHLVCWVSLFTCKYLYNNVLHGHWKGLVHISVSSVQTHLCCYHIATSLIRKAFKYWKAVKLPNCYTFSPILICSMLAWIVSLATNIQVVFLGVTGALFSVERMTVCLTRRCYSMENVVCAAPSWVPVLFLTQPRLRRQKRWMHAFPLSEYKKNRW